MKSKPIKYISPIAMAGIFAVLTGLGFSHNSYAANVDTASFSNKTLLMAAGRPYHHLNRNSNSIESQKPSNTIVVRTMRGSGNRPYKHALRTRVVERSEFAAVETGKVDNKRLRRNISKGGKPHYPR
jgi:hypothetical protein